VLLGLGLQWALSGVWSSSKSGVSWANAVHEGDHRRSNVTLGDGRIRPPTVTLAVRTSVRLSDLEGADTPASPKLLNPQRGGTRPRPIL
jgi:hypothetical protein